MGVMGVNEKGEKGRTVANLDEAMVETGFGIYNILHMLLSGLILMGVIMQNLALGYVMPAAQCDLKLNMQQRGWLAAIPFLAIILTSYFWGWIADTRGRRPVMMVSMIFSTIFSVLASFSPNLITFAVLEFISAVFMSGASAVVYTYLGEFHNKYHRDKMVAFGASFVGIGTVVLPGISWLVLPIEFAYPIPFLGIDYRPWRLLVVACALPFFFGSLFLLIAPESPKFLSAAGRREECLVVLRSIYSINKRMPPDTYPVHYLEEERSTVKTVEGKSGFSAILVSMKEQTVPLFKSPLLYWTLLTCFVQFGIFSATNGFYIWFPTILNSLVNHEGTESRICDVLDANRDAAHAANSTLAVCDDTLNTTTFEHSIYIGIVFCSMYIIVGFLVDCIGKKVIIVTTLFVTGVSAIAAHFAYNQTLAVVLFAIFQMSGACIGLMNAVAVELFPTKLRAMAICLSMMTGRLGSMFGSNIIGVLLSYNCGVSFYLFGGLVVACSLVCLTLPNKSSDSKKDLKITIQPTENETHEPV